MSGGDVSDRIRWTTDPRGSFLGYVGTIGPWLFQIFNPGLGNGEWALMAQFPGALGEYRYDGNPEKLKPAAEEWLNEFAASIGAVFTGPTLSTTSSRSPRRDDRG